VFFAIFACETLFRCTLHYLLRCRYFSPVTEVPFRSM
jgi:hypothetical protein